MIIRVYEARLRPGSEHDFMAGERELLTRTDVDGLLGASIGRRIAGGHTRVIVLTVWRDRASLETFLNGSADLEHPVYVPGAEQLVEAWSLTHYDAVDVPELAFDGDGDAAGDEGDRDGARAASGGGSTGFR